MNIWWIEIKINHLLFFILVTCWRVVLIPSKGILINILLSELHKLIFSCFDAQKWELYFIIIVVVIVIIMIHIIIYYIILFYLLVLKEFPNILLPLQQTVILLLFLFEQQELHFYLLLQLLLHMLKLELFLCDLISGLFLLL